MFKNVSYKTIHDIAQFRNCTYLQVYTFKAPESVSTKATAVVMRFPRSKKKKKKKKKKKNPKENRVTVLEKLAQQKEWLERKGGVPEPRDTRVKGYVMVEKECAEQIQASLDWVKRKVLVS